MDFRVLGLLEVSDDGRLVEFRSSKVRLLLAALLLHHNEVVSADRLIGAIWQDHAPESATNTLQGYVSQLRKALGADAIETRSKGYRLTVQPGGIDLIRFERLLVDGRAALAAGDTNVALDMLGESLALWRGDPFAEFMYEPFFHASVVRLNELRLTATEARVEAELRLGRHADVVGRLRLLVAEHPLRERLWEQLITALYRCGRQGEALRAFTEVRERLVEELGSEPGASLKSLEEAVLFQSRKLDWQPAVVVAPDVPNVPYNIPPARSTFVGREDELRELEKLVIGGGLITIVGPGGVGKSRFGR